MRVRKVAWVALVALKYFGLFPWSYDRVRGKLVCTQSDVLKCLVPFIVVNGFSGISLFLILTKQNDFFIARQNNTVFIYQATVTTISWICQTGTVLNCWLERGTNLRIFEAITHCDAKYVRVQSTFWKDGLFWLPLIWCGSCIINVANIFIAYPLLGYTLRYVEIVSTIFYVAQATTIGLIAFSYASVVVVLNDVLESLNFGIQKAIELKTCYSGIELKKLLIKRASILELCRCDVNKFYGICILFMLIHSVLISISLPLFIITMLTSHESIYIRIIMIVGSTLWCMNSFAGINIIFNGDCIDMQANRTAKILSRISRKGTGIEKMIDKFLMKNMHQEPILTAFGFFPLNKRTLFKIFAAIFTYMVILVQFKEMESTNKKLASGGKPLTTTTTTTTAVTTELTVS